MSAWESTIQTPDHPIGRTGNCSGLHEAENVERLLTRSTTPFGVPA